MRSQVNGAGERCDNGICSNTTQHIGNLILALGRDRSLRRVRGENQPALTVMTRPRKLSLLPGIRSTKEGVMDLIVRTDPPLPLRAWKALRSRGAGYAWHKFLRRSLSDWPAWKRRILYADPHRYWTLRGGDEYFREQEGQKARTLRARWLADRLAIYRPTSVLEVGCGYGKVLGELRRRLDIPLVGIDFSRTQLDQARRFLGDDG